jgi:hypothetical protein
LASDFKENVGEHHEKKAVEDVCNIKSDDLVTVNTFAIERPKRQITIVDEMYKKPKSIESTKENTQSPPYCIIN